MSKPGAVSLGDRTHHDGHHGRHPAQWYCLLAGLTLLLAGALGFLADASFDTEFGNADVDQTGNADGQLQGDGFLGFEVNGWHNLVHLASGLLLLFAWRRGGLARTVALGFGLTYGLVALIGLIDGNDVLGIIPVNGPDNVLHIGLSLLGILAALLPWPKAHGQTTTRAAAPRTTAGSRAGVGDHDGLGERDERFSRGEGRTLRPEDHDRVGADGHVVERDVRPTDRR
jgi:hypothetical protein